jgi:hypothetical protein
MENIFFKIQYQIWYNFVIKTLWVQFWSFHKLQLREIPPRENNFQRSLRQKDKKRRDNSEKAETGDDRKLPARHARDAILARDFWKKRIRALASNSVN